MKKTPPKKAPARTAAIRKPPAKKTAAKDAPRLSVKLPGIWFSKSAARKAKTAAQTKSAAQGKTSSKKTTPVKTAPKKAETKKAPAKKTPPKKAEAKKAPVKKTPPKKAEVKKAPVKKTPPKKVEVKKAPVKKTPPKKAEVKKAPVKKTPPKKVEAKKAPVKKPVEKKAETKKVETKKAVEKKVETKKVETKKAVDKKTVEKKAEDKKKIEASKAKKSEVVLAPVPAPAPAPTPVPEPAPAPESESVLGPISPPVVMTGPSTLPPEIVPLVPSFDGDDLFADEAAPAPQESTSFTKKDLAEFRAKLLALRSRHSGKAASLQAQSLTRPDEVNPEEDGTDASMRITEIGKAGMDEATVNDIDAALRAIDAGTYGVCQTCGGRIGKARLRAVPFAKNCASCQSEMEQDAARRRVPPSADYYG